MIYFKSAEIARPRRRSACGRAKTMAEPTGSVDGFLRPLEKSRDVRPGETRNEKRKQRKIFRSRGESSSVGSRDGLVRFKSPTHKSLARPIQIFCSSKASLGKKTVNKRAPAASGAVAFAENKGSAVNNRPNTPRAKSPSDAADVPIRGGRLA